MRRKFSNISRNMAGKFCPAIRNTVRSQLPHSVVFVFICRDPRDRKNCLRGSCKGKMLRNMP